MCADLTTLAVDPCTKSAPDDKVKLSICKRKIENRVGVEIICNATMVINKPADNQAIANTRTTDHFLKKDAPAEKWRKQLSQLKLKCPTALLKRAHTCVTSEYLAYKKN